MFLLVLKHLEVHRHLQKSLKALFEGCAWLRAWLRMTLRMTRTPRGRPEAFRHVMAPDLLELFASRLLPFARYSMIFNYPPRHHYHDVPWYSKIFNDSIVFYDIPRCSINIQLYFNILHDNKLRSMIFPDARRYSTICAIFHYIERCSTILHYIQLYYMMLNSVWYSNIISFSEVDFNIHAIRYDMLQHSSIFHKYIYRGIFHDILWYTTMC